MQDIPERARNWAIWLTRHASVTGSAGERSLPTALAERLAGDRRWDASEVWTIPTEEPERSCLAVLARGTGREALLLTGHFDTVAIDDYEDLRHLATEPEPLRAALLQRLSSPRTADEAMARHDLASGAFLPGRGLLDMKAGLAAALAAMEAFLADPRRAGNLLFVAVPDEEVNSIGARALAAQLPAIAGARGIDLVGAVNLDCIGDRGDGTLGRAVAFGSVGKLLPTALVIGRATHASHPLQGLNAGVLAAAIAARVEWSPALTDGSAGEPGIPPTLLSLKDGKRRYDVTTPETCFATWNVLVTGRPASAVFSDFTALVAEAVTEFMQILHARRPTTAQMGTAPGAVTILSAAAIVAEAKRSETAAAELAALAARLAADGASLPDQNEALTLEAWRRTGRSGPAVILGLGSLPYPAVALGEGAEALALRKAITTACVETARAGVTIGTCRFFPGISDMSFLGEAATEGLSLVAQNTPAWASGVRWRGEVGGIPIVNIGPWGRDYHTPLERVETAYAFEVLPRLLLAVARARFGISAPTP